MRGINIRPSRVYQATTRLLQSNPRMQRPSWYITVGQIPPGEIMTRPHPIQHQPPKTRSSKVRKPSKMFKPQIMAYEEDDLRRRFFSDHPWELARPRQILETDGRDGQRADWSILEQPHLSLSGESVVQRQLWLMYQLKMDRQDAYDKARKEFYQLRLKEDIERRIAKEEALYVGADFGPGILERGMKMEDGRYKRWKHYVIEEADMAHKIQNASMLTAQENKESGELSNTLDTEKDGVLA